MKYLGMAYFLLIATIVVIGLSGCIERNTKTLNGAEGSWTFETEVYQGHHYVVGSSGIGDSRKGGITHSPNCPCLNEVKQ